ncbi:PREDICTED: F-box only protein 39-like isoform X2 [Vollenhovia emeryi]|uniref:F-box only protein 39-like isoform X2 n=1 Tax=Vollenhovia emeryi TaxID=411798 RepID=UPI0005F45AF8|nr:PREDICTED: F-box only protein 39-like isoform X2 [Vollenhovia emeryi]
MWDQLPELILTQIFGHLDRADRASVSQVCRSWNRSLSSPVLWRSVTVLIDRDLRGDFPLAGELAAKYGQHMRSLELAFSRPYISPRQIRIRYNTQAEAGADFLAIVRAKDVQLRRLILTNWVFGYKWGNRGTLLCALANFLRGQRSLEILSLLNADFGVADVLRLLGTVVKGSGEHLVSLDLRGAFREWQAPHDNPRYLRLLGRFHALTLLKLDYPALSNHALDALANGASKTLKYLYISVRDSDSRQHMVADAAWRNLVLACPDLTVSYTIVEVMLQLRNNRESLDDLLVSMLIRCKRLTRLQYDGIIRSLETLLEICQLQAERKTHFRTIHVKPRNINTQNRAILHDINYRYDRKMHEQGVDFRIEDPTSILFFY